MLFTYTQETKHQKNNDGMVYFNALMTYGVLVYCDLFKFHQIYYMQSSS